MCGLISFGLYHRTVCLYRVFQIAFAFFIKNSRLKGNNLHSVVLVGSTENNLQLYYELTAQPWSGYKVVGYFDYQPNPAFPEECTYLGKPQEVIGFLKKRTYIRSLFCCLSSEHKDVIVPMINYCENNLVHFTVYPMYIIICRIKCILIWWALCLI